MLGIAWVDENGGYRRTADRPFADLADFPPLDYSLIQAERYTAYGYPNIKRQFGMISSKGCPFSCTFCFNSEFHRCRRRMYPREVLFQQIKTLTENYGVDRVAFIDEIFGVDKQELKAFCQGMTDRFPGFTWGADTRVGVLTREDMEMMYANGCRSLTFGLESGSAEMRKVLRKDFDDTKVDEAFRNCREVGFRTNAYFMLGLPDETPEQLRETVRLYFRTQPNWGVWFLYWPIPGSQLYRELEAAGRISVPTTLEAAAAHNTLTDQDLAKNYSRIPDKDLQVVQNFVNWQTVFRQRGYVKIAVSLLLSNLRRIGLRGLARELWVSAKLLCTVAWYAHAYPSIRKKYDLYAKNYGRTDWDD